MDKAIGNLILPYGSEGDKTMSKIILYEDKANCCGCGACLNICPKNAIEMKEDEYGFLYPQIDIDLCIECGKCKRVCSYQNEEGVLHKPLKVGAAMGVNNEMVKKSASGGVFAAVAQKALEKGGVVYGCAFLNKDGVIYPEHIRIDNVHELHKLQGSKYVQSIIRDTYKKVKSDLKNGKMTVFSGTPCQVAALKGYLGKTDQSNLFTIDIICHGTPGASFFQAYIKEVEKKIKGTVIDFRFRDKTGGWGLKGAIIYLDRNKKTKKKLMPVQLSSYYSLFLNSEIYRENCYSCKYAREYRPGDITIGDYWGFEEEHPELLIENGGGFDRTAGISCILVNTDKGMEWLEKLKPEIEFAPSSFEKVAKRNSQLKVPSIHTELREKVLNLYSVNGYASVDSWYYKRIGIKKYIYEMWNLFPRKLQVLIKKCI